MLFFDLILFTSVNASAQPWGAQPGHLPAPGGDYPPPGVPTPVGPTPGGPTPGGQPAEPSFADILRLGADFWEDWSWLFDTEGRRRADFAGMEYPEGMAPVPDCCLAEFPECPPAVLCPDEPEIAVDPPVEDQEEPDIWDELFGWLFDWRRLDDGADDELAVDDDASDALLDLHRRRIALAEALPADAKDRRRIDYCQTDKNCGWNQQCSRSGGFCVKGGAGGRWGDACTYPSHCDSGAGFTCSGSPPTNIGSCTKRWIPPTPSKKPFGSSCNFHSQCQSNYCKWNGWSSTCAHNRPTATSAEARIGRRRADWGNWPRPTAPKKQYRESCSYNSECQSNYCKFDGSSASAKSSMGMWARGTCAHNEATGKSGMVGR